MTVIAAVGGRSSAVSGETAQYLLLCSLDLGTLSRKQSQPSAAAPGSFWENCQNCTEWHSVGGINEAFGNRSRRRLLQWPSGDGHMLECPGVSRLSQANWQSVGPPHPPPGNRRSHPQSATVGGLGGAAAPPPLANLCQTGQKYQTVYGVARLPPGSHINRPTARPGWPMASLASLRGPVAFVPKATF